jgi:hypothetical protein
MERAYQRTKELYYSRIRVPKDEAYFVYFTFESNEGLCFFSTVEESIGSQFRDIDVKCSIETKTDLKALIARLQTELRLDILSEEIIPDL